MKTLRRYERATGVLAIDASAFFDLFLVASDAPENDERPEATIVDIRGPLEQHAGSWCDSYADVTRRVALACESAARAVVLRLDTPGGVVDGCFQTARDIRAMCEKAGKPLYAWVDGKACSAGYALACAAQSITLSDTAIVGSVGVLSKRPDVSQANAQQGLRFAFVASSQRKADGNPDAPITDGELARMQTIVDSTAAVFFDLVAELRGTLTAEQVAQLDAGIFHGAAALDARLADSIASLPTLLATIAGGIGSQMPPDDDKKKDDDKKDGDAPPAAESAYNAARAALHEAAKVDDANGRAAKRALAAMDMEDDVVPADDDDKDKKDDKSTARAYATAAQALAEVHKLRAETAAEKAGAERARLIESRPDFAPELVASLQKAPIETVRDIVATMPRGALSATTATAAAALAAAGVKPLAGKEHGSPHAARLPPAEKAALDARMGLTSTKTGVVETEYKLTFGAPVADDAASTPAPRT